MRSLFVLGTGPQQVTRRVLRRVGCRAFTPDLLVCLAARGSAVHGWLSLVQQPLPLRVAAVASIVKYSQYPLQICRFGETRIIVRG